MHDKGISRLNSGDRTSSDATGSPAIEANRREDGRLDAEAFRHALGHFATGITIVTAVAPSGELLGVTLPRRAPVAMTVGRGYVSTSGTLDLLQAAGPSASVG